MLGLLAKKLGMTQVFKEDGNVVPVTVLKAGNQYVVDPTYEEEKVYDARLSVAVEEDGTLCALQKGGDEALSDEDILAMIDIAAGKTEELRKLL